MSNYALIKVRDAMARLEGVGDVMIFGQQDYSMRRVAESLPADFPQLDRRRRGQGAPRAKRAGGRRTDRTAAGREGVNFQYTMTTLGRLTEPEQFGDIVLKTGADGQITRLRDVARIELGAKSQDISNHLDNMPAIGMGVFQLPGSNVLDTAARVKAKMKELKSQFPAGLDYAIAYDTTPYISESISEVFRTLRDAVLLVAAVVLVFLQNWRSALIPLVAVPVAIIGTFAAMAVMGFSLNTLSLFGLVLAIGIVVDDAIVVVEATEHHIEQGMAPRTAAHQAMAEVSAPVFAIGLVLTCVFLPCVFISGITGLFFRQFALDDRRLHRAVDDQLADLEPGAVRRAAEAARRPSRPAFLAAEPPARLVLQRLQQSFRLVHRRIYRDRRQAAANELLVLLVYGGLLYLTVWTFGKIPTGFIPAQDQGYLFTAIQLPDSSSMERTEAVAAKATDVALHTKGIAHAISVTGLSFILGANGSHLATMFIVLDPFDKRESPDLSADAIAQRLRAGYYKAIPEANVAVFGAPPVRGLGRAGGFKIMIEDQGNAGMQELQDSTDEVVRTANDTRRPV